MKLSELVNFAKEEDERRRRLGLDNSTLDRMAKAYALTEFVKRDDIYSNSSLAGLKELITQIKPFSFSSIQDANLSAIKMIEELVGVNPAINGIKALAGTRADEWMNFKELYAPRIPIEKFFSSHLSQITQTSILAQSALAGVEFSRIGGAFSVPDEIKTSFANGFTDFSTSYKNLFKSFEVPETSLFRLPPSISRFPTVEFFNGVDLLETTVEEENQDQYEEERISVRDEIRESTNDSVIIQLREVNKDWTTMLEGARQALASTNPDKTRHCITSLRELVREVMHHLSPDEEIKGWSQSPDDFDKNRPTRRARLRFITRNINHGAFTKFVEKDIEATLAAIDIFQAGTHVANSKLTEVQISALLGRIEGFILFLFSIKNDEN
jgi:hypothetical protein